MPTSSHYGTDTTSIKIQIIRKLLFQHLLEINLDNIQVKVVEEKTLPYIFRFLGFLTRSQ